MDALILACSTGGGHYTAALAVQEALIHHGWHADLMDPYTLAGNGLENKVGGGYVGVAQKAPRLFGAAYSLAEAYRRTSWHSPVYQLNRAMRPMMKDYLDAHHYDVILSTHLYPAEILTYMKEQGDALPPTVFVATDYACIPFTEETRCDRYAIPAADLAEAYIRRGIPAEKLVITGIPVRRAFTENVTRAEARNMLNLPQDKRCLLVSGGSIGAGQVERTVESLRRELDDAWHVVVVCGSNEGLHRRLGQRFGDWASLTLLGRTEQMALYMKACDAFLSKPGGLSSTEAAVSGAFLIHLPPIPGCETSNADFFSSRGMSIAAGSSGHSLTAALHQLSEPGAAEAMRRSRRAVLPEHAAENLWQLAEVLAAHSSERK